LETYENDLRGKEMVWICCRYCK